MFATVETFEIVFFVTQDGNTCVYDRLCQAIACLVVYTQWMKLLFTMWVTFHLFCLSVLHKNLKKLEVLYVVTSLLVPAVIAAVPLITHTYGLSPLGCYIYPQPENTTDRIAFIERFSLWDAPAMSILLAASTAMIVVIVKFTHAVCRRSKYEPITDGDQYWKALKQLLPLAAFPILFFLFLVPEFVYGLSSERPTLSKEMKLSAAVFISLWGMSSGATLIVHISVACLCTHGSARGSTVPNRKDPVTDRRDTYSHVNSTTHFTLPND